ncbi:hypothetical protein BKI52_39255 [marine bacterium AO1-C]|nr:hypothetical protein BKI52_39255 [marine bacterium AO1-C]
MTRIRFLFQRFKYQLLALNVVYIGLFVFYGIFASRSSAGLRQAQDLNYYTQQLLGELHQVKSHLMNRLVPASTTDINTTSQHLWQAKIARTWQQIHSCEAYLINNEYLSYADWELLQQNLIRYQDVVSQLELLLRDKSALNLSQVIRKQAKVFALEQNIHKAMVLQLTIILEKNQQYIRQRQANDQHQTQAFNQYLWFFIALCLVTSIAISYYFFVQFSSKVDQISTFFKQLMRGNRPTPPTIAPGNELYEVVHLGQKITDYIQNTSQFVDSLKQGDYTQNFAPLGKKDTLRQNLVELAQNLKKYQQEEQVAQWQNQGLLKFRNQIRQHSQQIGDLCQEAVVFLANYLEAAQCAIYTLETPEKTQPYFELGAFLAYDRVRYAQKKFCTQEGLLGRVMFEKKNIYLTDLPCNYLKVKSGLGDMPPKALLLIPCMTQDKIEGVLEMAFFDTITDSQVAFLEKIGEDIANSIANLRVSKKTHYLLEIYKLQTEELSAAEEAMVQHVEELETTQVKMREREVQLEISHEELSVKNDILKDQSVSLEKSYQEIKEKEEELRTSMHQLEEVQQILVQEKEKLEHQNKLITSSIKYAQTIQQAILPHKGVLNSLFSGYFVIYQPKDIVSGDFYWTIQLQQYVFVAAVDCTGHGVPGAFMSMIGSNLLNQIVSENGITDPGQILGELHLKIRSRLKQAEKRNSDGMDICLCRIEKINHQQCEVLFAGAKRPLYYAHQNKIHKLKGDRMSIGGVQLETERIFSTHKLSLDRHKDTIYLSSDGFADIPNERRRNFGERRLLKALDAHKHKPMSMQKIALQETLSEFQGNTEQRDDITLVGVKV